MRIAEKGKSEKQEDAGGRKGRKVTIHCVYPRIWGSGESKRNLAKAAGAESAGQMRDEKLHAVWTLSCRKSALRCGAKHISKSKCTKHTILGPLLEVQMSKKCTPLWREAHIQVKSVKD